MWGIEQWRVREGAGERGRGSRYIKAAVYTSIETGLEGGLNRFSGLPMYRTVRPQVI